ncbi:protein translocase subunit SecF [Actinomycetospora chibensis]|uniref:Protein-export membrane protein SecF n=1 Tax=Actinomycetospora chibensis TaxID=663606 RepID=A0ABV9RSF3_9PSEU|nr:protein translocase subunit SecF [Actinomycetospora chibensis]MDD7927095.1 protein translocase subunit SecF [Actinomycetospora chibensis]
MTRSTSGPNNRRTDAVTSGDTHGPAGRGNGRASGRRRAEDAPPEDEVRDDLTDDPANDGTDVDGADDDDPTGEAAADAPDERDDSSRPRRRSRLDSLYRGNGGIDIVGRSKTWYAIFGVALIICILSMVIRGFNFGIDFEGGTSVQMPAVGANGPIATQQVEQAYTQAVGLEATSVQSAGQGATSTIIIRSERLDVAQVIALRQTLFERFQPLGTSGTPDQNAISDSAVSASWGGEITRQAGIALVVFLVLVTIYLSFYFERRMALAALIALANDIIITAGVYSLVGFEVSPATVIGLLTILGFSLYDTVVVFDKVRENTRGLLGLTRRTYAEAANLAVNQTLMRSLNTSLIAALPLVGLFIVGVVLLGVGVLGDLALVQLVGTIVGAASSVLLATPIVVDLAMRNKQWAAQAEKVAARRAKNARRAEGGDGAQAAADGPSTDVLDTREVAAAGARSSGARDGDGRAAAPRPGARPTGRSGRPSGKRRR